MRLRSGDSPAPGLSYQLYHGLCPMGSVFWKKWFQIGIGFGVNVKDHLKFDFTLAEDIPYTFGHIFSGLKGNITSRVSVAYQF